MKLRRVIKARNYEDVVVVDVTITRQDACYTSNEVKEKRKQLSEGIFDLLRNRLGFEIEKITMK